ncbi:MAG: MinD/ParA family protein [Firmicutes bacterium HGW-Firmicutes-1]|jgi:flagellar biosynthesis protein FlhG|nr:MAG: MinD/ParA family protein [Firmicutes bacterium HGW-Firmicutes-1]
MDQASNLRNIIKNNQVNYKKNDVRVITVTSGKGGVGKSNVSVNLAINFRRQGKRVVIFDADFGLANIEIIFGIAPKYSMYDMIFNNMSITDILTSAPFGIEFISGGSGIQELVNLSRTQLNYMISKLYDLDCLADIIIIDTGAGISDSVLDFVTASNEVLLITTPEPTSITDAYSTLKAMKNRGGNSKDKIINLLVNKASGEAEGLEIYKKLNKVTERFLDIKLKNVGYLPYDKTLEKAVIEQKPVAMLFPKSNISKAIEKLADNLLGNEESNDAKPLGISNLFSNILKMKKVK